MTFSISLDHTKNEIWQQLREQQWEKICRQSFPTSATEDELKPYRDYFFTGDICAAIENGAYTDFGTMLFWSPANNLDDLKNIFIYYWKWFFSDDDNIKIYQGYKFEGPDEYLNSVLLQIAGWNYYQPPKLMAELFFWVFGEQYNESRLFPIPLGENKWQPKIEVKSHVLAIFILRGVRGYLFSYDKETIFQKYQFLVGYLLSVFQFIEPRVYFLGRMKDNEVDVLLNHTDQKIMRWFVANLEGISTKREVRNNNGEIPHNDIETEEILRKGLSKLDLPEGYHQLVDFVREHDEECLSHFDA